MSGSIIVNWTGRIYDRCRQACISSASYRMLAATDRLLAEAVRSSTFQIKLLQDIPGKYFESSRLSKRVKSLAVSSPEHPAGRIRAMADSSRFMSWLGGLGSISARETGMMLNMLLMAMLSGNLLYHVFYDYERTLILADAGLLALLALLHGTDWDKAWDSSRASAVLEWILDIGDEEKDRI